MSTLAIKGHPTRGSEVIALLEMLGGINVYNLYGDESYAYYVIEHNEIRTGISIFGNKPYTILTLEEFEAKFPYKVGDKVIKEPYVGAREICEMRWEDSRVKYGIGVGEWFTAKQLQPYKEQETMKNTRVIISENGDKVLLKTLTHDMTEINIDKDYEIIEVNGKYYAVKKKPQYPKTFIEVLNFWHPDRQLEDDYQRCYKKDLVEKLQDLLYARGAYWKIAGEQMGLGKPWEPDWLNVEQDKYVLFTHNNAICSNCYVLGHNILAFPTAEMRDAFYENFKDLINQTKELL